MTNHHENTRTLPRLLVAAIALAGTTLLLASPSVGTAQAPLPECMHCEFSPFGGWPSTICVFDDSGWNECEQVGRAGDHDCNPSGGGCGTSSASAESDAQAVHMVIRGETLPADGNYFFVVDEGYKAVMRKCDNAVVARVSMTQMTQAITVVVRQRGDGGFSQWHLLS